MKKLICVFLISVVFLSMAYGKTPKDLSSSLHQPPQIEIEGAYLIDLRCYKKAEDNLVFVNKTKVEKIICDVYYVDPQTCQWVKSDDSALLKKKGDSDIVYIDKTRDLELEDITFVAYTVNPDGEYLFSYKVKDEDLYIYLGK